MIVAGRPGDPRRRRRRRRDSRPPAGRAPGSRRRDRGFSPASKSPCSGSTTIREGLAVAFDAVRDADTAALLLQAVTGQDHRSRAGAPGALRHELGDPRLRRPARLHDLRPAGRRPAPGPRAAHRARRAGFNHVAPPVAVWRRGGRDLGVVQEHLAGGSSGMGDGAYLGARPLRGASACGGRRRRLRIRGDAGSGR